MSDDTTSNFKKIVEVIGQQNRQSLQGAAVRLCGETRTAFQPMSIMLYYTLFDMHDYDSPMLPVGKALFGVLNHRLPELVRTYDLTAALNVLREFERDNEDKWIGDELLEEGFTVAGAIEFFGLDNHPATDAIVSMAYTLATVTTALDDAIPELTSFVEAIADILNMLRVAQDQIGR